MDRDTIYTTYIQLKDKISERLTGFNLIYLSKNEKQLFLELAFCLLTPQSRPRNAEKVLNRLIENDLLYTGKKEELSEHLAPVRFKNRKAQYLIHARDHINNAPLGKILRSLETALARRRYLVASFKGMGMKEASHFLRNSGFDTDVAILDRHVLRTMEELSIIDSIPKSITPETYDCLEAKLQKFAKEIHIPMSYLDFVIFYLKTGELFK